MSGPTKITEEEFVASFGATAPAARSTHGSIPDLRVRGKTYEVRGQLRTIGCSWDGATKCWVAPNVAVLKQAQEIVAGQALAPPPADLRAASTDDLAVELVMRDGWERAVGKHRIALAARQLGLRVGEEVGDSLGDLLVGDPPAVEELGEALRVLEAMAGADNTIATTDNPDEVAPDMRPGLDDDNPLW